MCEDKHTTDDIDVPLRALRPLRHLRHNTKIQCAISDVDCVVMKCRWGCGGVRGGAEQQMQTTALVTIENKSNQQ